MTDLIHSASAIVDHRVAIGTDDGLIGPGADGRSLGGRVTAVAASTDGLWAVLDGSALWHIGDEATTQVAEVPGGAARALAVDGDTVWLGGSDARLWRLRDDQLECVTSFDQAPTHDRWYTPWGGPPDVFSIAARDGVVYVNVHVGGILRSVDDGQTWDATIDLDADVHDVAIDDSGTVWAATGGRGLVTSSDRGETWTSYTDGLHSHYAIAVTPTSGGALMFAASGPRARDGQLYRLDGNRLVVSEMGLPDSLGGTVWSAGLGSSGDLAALAAPDGAVYLSDDGGRRWSRMTDDVGATAVVVR